MKLFNQPPNSSPGSADTGKGDAKGGDGKKVLVFGQRVGAGGPDFESLQATGLRRRRRYRSRRRNIIEWVVVLSGALLVAVIARVFVVQAFYIPSESMEPTLRINDRVLVSKVGYDLGDVEVGDIIVFERPDSWGAGNIEDLIKRVVALPGQTISVSEGQIYVDGEELEEPWLRKDVATPVFLQSSDCVPSCTVPDDSVFVLGDNRNNSAASNQYGPVPFDDVVGRAFFRIWPLSGFGPL